MKKKAWQELIVRTVAEANNGDTISLDLLSSHLVEIDEAKQELRNKGYGWTGLSILETIKTEVPPARYFY